MHVSTFKELTRIEQTLFGLPLLLAGAILPFSQLDVEIGFRFLWIVPAFMLARISGMAFNQLIDSEIDAKNSRTKNRVIPLKKISIKHVQIIAWGALTCFLFVCFQINFLIFLLAPLAAFLLYIYSYTKRFTIFCHFILGAIHFLAPVMASIAISGTILLPAFCLGLGVAFSITGSDIIYATQDVFFDKKHHLFSFPSRLGIEKSLSIARLAHLGSLLMFFLVGITGRFPIFYYALIILLAKLFYNFHKKINEKNIESSFFFCNTMAGILVFGFILGSVVWDVI